MRRLIVLTCSFSFIITPPVRPANENRMPSLVGSNRQSAYIGQHRARRASLCAQLLGSCVADEGSSGLVPSLRRDSYCQNCQCVQRKTNLRSVASESPVPHVPRCQSIAKSVNSSLSCHSRPAATGSVARGRT